MNAARLHASVVICTHDRAATLSCTIESVLAQDYPAEGFELIVVDNRSSDETPAVVDRFRARATYVSERRLGLSHARNTGLQRAAGEYVVLIDDDAIARPDWLATIVAAFGTDDDGPSCVGGRVVPMWEAPRPSWLADALLPSLTIADWSEHAHAVTDLGREWLVGANIAFRRSVLVRMGGFSPRLGRKGGRLLSGEEVFLQKRLLDEGATCWYEPSAVVEHAVPAKRLERGWFRRRYYAQGVSDATMWRLERNGSGGSWRRALEEARPLLDFRYGIGALMRGGEDADAFVEQCGVLWRLGFIAGLLRPS